MKHALFAIDAARFRPVRRNVLLPAALLLMFAAGCARPVVESTPSSQGVTAGVVATLEASADAWNAGDLGGFLAPYRDLPTTTFVGGAGLLRGREAIRASYLRSYWKNGAPEGTLRFRDIEVRPLGADYALAVGRYAVEERRTGKQNTGLFSLVLARTAEGWKIIHDHSS